MRRRVTGGFTLIEMLVTIALFSMTLGSLVVGLRSGASTWERVHTHQVDSAEAEAAFARFSDDIRHMALLSEEIAPLAEAADDAGAETLSITTLGRRDRQRVGLDAVWWQVAYAVEESDDGKSRNWVRRAARYVTTSPMQEDERVTVLLRDVESVKYTYFDGQSMQPVWETEESWPRAVEVTVRFEGGGTLRKRVLWPLAWLNEGRL